MIHTAVSLSEVKFVQLDRVDFKKINTNNEYRIVYVDKHNYLNYREELFSISQCIRKTLPNWDIDLAPKSIIQRFNSDSHCLLFYFNDKCIGWNWGNTSVKFDWINEIKKLPNGFVYFGGCFICKQSTPPDAGLINFNYIFDYWLNKKNFDTIVGYIHNWNKASMRICLQNNLKIKDWFNDNG
jgi:hypothetical protein